MDLNLLTLEELKRIADNMVAKRKGEIDKSWEEIVDELGLNMSKDNFRKASLGAVIERTIHELEMKEKSTDEEIEKLDAKIKEYRAERYKWMDVRASKRREERQYARTELLLEMIEQIAERKNETYPFLRESSCPYEALDNEGIIMISDVHYGLECNVVGNVYSPDITIERFKMLANKIIDYSELHKIKTLHIFFLGDLINGLIHTTTKLENKYQVIDQVLDMSEIISSFVYLLSESFEKIEVYYTSGNHERVNPRKEDNLNEEDFGRIMLRHMELRLNNIEKISIHTEVCTGILEADILDYKIFAVHGDKDRVQTCVGNLSRIMNEVPDFVLLGHYHHLIEESVGNTEVIANGSFCGNSEYSIKGRLISPPMQRFLIFNEQGRLCTYNINLQQ